MRSKGFMVAYEEAAKKSIFKLVDVHGCMVSSHTFVDVQGACLC
jgi:hypothetical protein